jgi:hypothetical protein
MKIIEARPYLVALTATLAIIGGWWLMIAAGTTHHEWTSAVPIIDFWGAVKIAAIWAVVISVRRARARYAK